MSPDKRFTPPRRARRRIACLVVTPLMLSRRIFRRRFALPFSQSISSFASSCHFDSVSLAFHVVDLHSTITFCNCLTCKLLSLFLQCLPVPTWNHTCILEISQSACAPSGQSNLRTLLRTRAETLYKQAGFNCQKCRPIRLRHLQNG